TAVVRGYAEADTCEQVVGTDDGTDADAVIELVEACNANIEVVGRGGRRNDCRNEGILVIDGRERDVGLARGAWCAGIACGAGWAGLTLRATGAFWALRSNGSLCTGLTLRALGSWRARRSLKLARCD